ncbi:hypothetical protein [Pedobacter sp. UBA5917]|jgi:(p)ppGpp synthase/HD superfamily hydrolase|uniref:hypothetical protein n=1 Tax=Pedobacter sp. UBA5917 TaxID=1947061 RepID=UPI0025EA1EF2|nr:hypothetical protein [Pedobacter sp. UBA5917]
MLLYWLNIVAVTEKQMIGSEQLANWVAEKHRDQLIKCTHLPYFDHLNKVAQLVKDVVKWGYEIGLCHDLLEDTNTTGTELKEALIRFGYDIDAAEFIVGNVTELTDVFTKTAYPDLSKKQRKNLENKRLQTLGTTAQTVKYADLIDNAAWMMKYDTKHAAKYLKKKAVLLLDLKAGNNQLRQQAMEIIEQGQLVFRTL